MVKTLRNRQAYQTMGHFCMLAISEEAPKMFPQKISQNIDTLARIHGNVFPWQPAIMGN